MNYYNEIKKELINNEVYKKIKDYSKNKSDLTTYYNVGKLLYEAGNKYGECIIKEYSNKLIIDVGKKYNERTLRRMRQFFKMFNNEKWSPLATKLTWSHYTELLPIKDKNKLLYYLNISINQNLSRNDLRKKIKTNGYERLDEITKQKLIKKDKEEVQDFIKNPIIIKTGTDYNGISEKVLKKLILEDIDNFLIELGECFSYIKNEYKIKLGDRYNYIDLLLYNIKFNCYVVVELKVTELKKEHIGQKKLYMNYIDKNIKTINQDKTIGIIICKKDNKFVMEYCSDNRIFRATYILN